MSTDHNQQFISTPMLFIVRTNTQQSTSQQFTWFFSIKIEVIVATLRSEGKALFAVRCGRSAGSDVCVIVVKRAQGTVGSEAVWMFV